MPPSVAADCTVAAGWVGCAVMASRIFEMNAARALFKPCALLDRQEFMVLQDLFSSVLFINIIATLSFGRCDVYYTLIILYIYVSRNTVK